MSRVLQAKYKYVIPHIGEEIEVPDSVDAARCRDIVEDLNSAIFNYRIDSIVQRGIEAHAMPGCQIVVMHNGRMLMNKAYGHLTYAPASPAVTSETVYDLASLTKVCATTLAIMYMYENGRLDINDSLGKFLPYLRGTDKESITIKQALSHCAGLKAYDALWQQTDDRDSILKLIAESPLRPDNGYCYSDFGFMLLADVVEHISGKTLDKYVADEFYTPMGLGLTFKPQPSLQIAPTEEDSLRGEICGTVHDPNAYAMGGVSGHAGLFGTAMDVARLMQVLLDGGECEKGIFFDRESIATFTSRHFAKQGNRRALGFDKQLFTPSKSGQACPEASQASYGHTGFTGTMLWVDPEYNLVYVFLSNRTYPSSAENKLAKMNIRTEIQSLIYNYIESK